MKLCGCLPLKYDPEKSLFDDCIRDLRAICDEIVVMHDWGSDNSIGRFVSEEIRVTQQEKPFWHDYANRITLAARAARLDCDFIVQLDDDELLGPSLTRERALEICRQVKEGNYSQARVSVRTVWNEKEWRADGIYEKQVKTFFQVNPLLLKNPSFQWGFDKQLHHFPNLDLPALKVEDYIYHFGLRTPSLRRKYVEKYERQDPECKFSAWPYAKHADEEGLILKPID